MTFSGFIEQGAVRVTYTTRPLPGGKFGIHVKTFRNGFLETEDLNTTPWPDSGTAFLRARRTAETTLEQETT